jgi:uncharacterized repeat protein (TIGR03847 family)
MMPNQEILLDPVDHITVDAIGSPGNRVFYIEGRKGGEVVSLIIEKVQLQSLVSGIDDFLAQVQEKFPERSVSEVDFREKDMHIEPPVDPKFRVGEIGLAYDGDRDMVNIIAREMDFNGDQESTNVVRYGCTRSQLIALARWGAIVVQRGRPICPQCLQPMEPEGHFCPKKNGHKKAEIE